METYQRKKNAASSFASTSGRGEVVTEESPEAGCLQGIRKRHLFATVAWIRTSTLELSEVVSLMRPSGAKPRSKETFGTSSLSNSANVRNGFSAALRSD